jgi:tetratricopeptide (TPR) repeat protein
MARLAETPVQVFIGLSARGQTAFESGRFIDALALTGQASALFEPSLLPEIAQAYGESSSLMPHIYHFWALYFLGRPDAAVRKRDVVLAAAEALPSPFLLGVALLFEMILWRELRDNERTAGVAERLAKLAYEQEFVFLYAFAQLGQGWVACHRGDLVSGTAQIRKGIDLHEATGAQLTRRYVISYLVEAHLAAGRLEEGIATLREILVRPEDRLSGFIDAELFRLEGELLRASGEPLAAEASYRKALDIARDQEARAYELRTATSLGRLLAEQGRVDEALALLAAVYQAFTEDFATHDLLEARGLLDQLISTGEGSLKS